MIVRTVLGDVEPGTLGPTYAHEHLIIDSANVEDHLPEIHLPSVDEAVAELERCRAAGLAAVVDAMPCAAGRDVVRLAEVSSVSEVHIVATTGLHTPAFYRHQNWAIDAPADRLAELFTADIEVGVDRYDYTGPIVDRTGHRAGIIKVATMGEITDRDRRLFEAAAHTHRHTGAPILTHCEGGAGGLEQIALLDHNAVSPVRVVLSHTDKILDLGYHRGLLESGANLVYDQALRQPPDAEHGTAWLVESMVESGYADQLMVGTDGARRSMWATLGGSPGLAWLLTGFTEMLKRRGLDDETLRALLVANPARFLAFEPA
jgi:5-phospho-D-xylono-1,4-lactonase